MSTRDLGTALLEANNALGVVKLSTRPAFHLSKDINEVIKPRKPKALCNRVSLKEAFLEWRADQNE